MITEFTFSRQREVQINKKITSRFMIIICYDYLTRFMWMDETTHCMVSVMVMMQ